MHAQSGLMSVLRIALLSAALSSAGVHARGVDVVVGGPGRLAPDAVVSLHSPQATAALKTAPAIVDQRNTQFTPLVSVVHAGSRVTFPNSDNVRHQVYSFSPAKRFQLPLYAGKTAPPVTFDKTGVVELGCNIHDAMVAFVVVVDTPYHAITDMQGRAFVAAPPGRYRMRVWHPHLQAGSAPWEGEVVIGAEKITRRVALPLAAAATPPAQDNAKLRALQEKLRKLKRDD